MADWICGLFPEYSDHSHGDELSLHATYGFTRKYTDVEEAVDGWYMSIITAETSDALELVGLMWVLPTAKLPMRLQLVQLGDGSIRYTLRVGVLDRDWESFSESKQWKLVYLHATEGTEPAWTWGQAISGVCAEAQGWGSNT